ncbi:MAG: alpha/beta hydrolase [Dehalococcoidia bacterium]
MNAIARVVTAVALALLGLIAWSDRGLSQGAGAIAWSPCGARLQCGTVRVPLDYAAPGDRQIEIAVARQVARDPARRIGALLTNPGGPGASGVDFVRGWAAALAPEVQDRFDIVGFDPRGIGRSTPALQCHDQIQQLVAQDPNPATPAAWAEVQRTMRAFADLCAARAGDLLPHLGSLDVVRDMDRIREALDEDRVSYFGYSYGTVLGALYADQFPERLRAVVLDGPVAFGRSADDLALTQAVGFERELERYLEDCRAKRCALAAGNADPRAAIDSLLARSRERPIPAASADRPAGPGETLLAMVSALYGPWSWPALTRAVQQGLDGDGSGLIRLADRYLDRSGNGYPNSFEMNAALNCVDYAYNRDPAHYVALAAEFAREAPHFGPSNATGTLICAYWAAPPKPIGIPRATGAPPLLVVAATHDPATPLAWALDVRRELASAVLLKREGDGHTSYASGNACVDGAVNRYLVGLAVPEDGAVCGTEIAPRAPSEPPSTRSPAGADAPAYAGRGVPFAAVLLVAIGCVVVIVVVVSVRRGGRESL